MLSPQLINLTGDFWLWKHCSLAQVANNPRCVVKEFWLILLSSGAYSFLARSVCERPVFDDRISCGFSFVNRNYILLLSVQRLIVSDEMTRKPLTVEALLVQWGFGKYVTIFQG